MSSRKLSRSTQLTALLGSALVTCSLVVACGDNNDVPGYDTGGASGSSAANGGRSGANGGRAGANSGKAGANGESGEAGMPDQGETGGGSGAGGSTSGAGTGGAGTGGTSGAGGSLSGAGTGGTSGAGGSMSGAGGSMSGAGGSMSGAGGSMSGAGGSMSGAGGSMSGAGGSMSGAGGSMSGAGGSMSGAGGSVSGAGGSTGGAGGTCGNGIKEGAEQCDDATAGSTSSASPKCSNTCTSVSTQACVDCENDECFDSVNNCLGVDPVIFTSTQQTQCYDVMTCVEQSNCFDGTGTISKCYCGTLSTNDCSAAPFTGEGSPNGLCVAQIKAGFPTFTTNAQIIGGLSATNFPSGAALSRLSCQKTANQAACLGVCGFTAGGAAFP